MNSVLQFIEKRWFVIGLLILIPAGFAIGGMYLSDHPGGLAKQAGTVSKFLTPLVLFLMSVTLDSRKLWDAIRDPGPVAWASATNYLVIPLVALGLLPLQQHADFAAGLMVAASVPCTMAAASVWTRKADGNDAVSMLVTILTNGLCFLITPLWLQRGIGTAISIDVQQMILKLLYSALLPIVVGQLVRVIPWARQSADRLKTPLGVIAQVCLLAIVFWAAVQGGPQLRSASFDGTLLGAMGVVWLSVICLHTLGLVCAYFGGTFFRFTHEDRVAATFAGSQKTLPIGVYIATELLQGVPFAVYPVIMFHASQLVMDTLVVDLLKMSHPPAEPPATDELASEQSAGITT